MFGEEEKIVVKIRPEANVLTVALFDLMDARKALKNAKKSVPSYTGDRSDKDYYETEQNTYNIAANAYADAVRMIVSTEPTDMTTYYEYQVGMSVKIEDLGLPEEEVEKLQRLGVVFMGNVFEFITTQNRFFPESFTHDWWKIRDVILPSTMSVIYASLRKNGVPFTDVSLEKWIQPEL